MPPSAPVRGFDDVAADASDILRRIVAGVHDRINRRAAGYGIGRKWSADYQAALRRDARAIREYREQRIVRSGSGLETAEGRHAAPDLHARMRDWRDA